MPSIIPVIIFIEAIKIDYTIIVQTYKIASRVSKHHCVTCY